jgi:hypothetical protein
VLVVTVVAACGLGAGYSLFVPPRHPPEATTRKLVESLLHLHVLIPEADCAERVPLAAISELDEVARDLHDAWGQPLFVSCSERTFEVRSPGPDGQLDSADDIVARREQE